MQSSPPDVSRVLGRLKDFQRTSAEYVFRRLYTDADAVDRFLLADEVGLGKTHVARGVIAQALEHLWKDVPRLDVIYLCSNAEIASQNISRLWFKELGDPDNAFSSRITLLPLHTRDIKGRKVNFVSFTPGTSLDLRSREGIAKERALLHVLLEEAWTLKGKASLNLLQGGVSETSWRGWLNWVHSERSRIDSGLKSDFLQNLRAHPEIRERFEHAYERFAEARTPIPREDRERRRSVVGELRRLLARSCIQALEPDLVILDEFQRFRHLLSDQDEVAQLARDLFSYVSESGLKTKVLMLSATPYKMYTQAHESEDNHYSDFLRTTRFLMQSDEASQQFERELAEFRTVLQAEAADPGALTRARGTLERRLRRVMCRTERLGVTPDRNGMLVDRTRPTPAPSLDEVRAFRALDALCHTLDVGEPVEYWKSAPYPLNFMDRGYQLKRALLERIASDPTSLSARLAEAARGLLPWKNIQAYAPVDPGNARLRALMASAVDSGGWKLLWLPPALPYYEARGVYAEPGVQGFTKSLVFSAWQMVPRAVSALASYEAERRMVRQGDAEVTYEDLRKHHRALLRFARESATGRLTGMPLFTLLYPSPTLATQVDPLALARALQAHGQVMTAEAVLERATEVLERLLEPHLTAARARGGAEDEAWYWAAPLLLDRERFAASLGPWLVSGGELSWRSAQGDPEESTHFTEHVARAAEALRAPPELGRPPADLMRVLAKVAVASPAVSMLRSLGRRWPEAVASAELLGSAARVAMGFRGLFNQPEVTHLLRGLEPREPYWERVLDYSVDGNLQSVLDEYMHMLDEGSEDTTAGEAAVKMATTIQTALSLRTVRLDVHDFELGERPALVERGVRCRYAVRFGDGLAEEGEEETREDQVRTAFNSPFRPFILASTSVGQEGLDFHPYCHAIHHWNLPTNPVDLEQREGRIHRFKGHVIRKNLAARHGLAAATETGDPWAALFAQAVKERPAELSDLVPYWIFEGPHKLERHVPLLPFSRDHDRFAQLKHSLALYRLVFGQPRQEDLLRYLQEEAAGGRQEELLKSRIDLSPRP